MIIHTVYRPEDNISILEEWLQYHTDIGVEKFYMFDNGGGCGNWGMKVFNVPENYSKTFIKNKYTVEEARELQKPILEKFNVEHILWPNEQIPGVKPLGYAYNSSILHLLNEYKDTGLCAFIDIDEYIIKKEPFKECRLKQHVYERINNIKDSHKRVIFTVLEELHLNTISQTKCILDLSKLEKDGSFFHKDFINDDNENRLYDMHFRALKLENSLSHFNHYNMTKARYRKYKERKMPYSNMPYSNIYEYVEEPFK